jgi:hypothetical protein
MEMPAPMLEIPHPLDPVSPDLSRKDCPEPVSPEPHCLMCDVDAALVQQILDIPERGRVPDAHHRRQEDDFGARLEVAEYAGMAHAREAGGSGSRHKPIVL